LRALALLLVDNAAGTDVIQRLLKIENILTDGRRLFFADYGLAISSRFELAQDEADFFREHGTYDRCYSVTHLVNWLAVAL